MPYIVCPICDVLSYAPRPHALRHTCPVCDTVLSRQQLEKAVAVPQPRPPARAGPAVRSEAAISAVDPLGWRRTEGVAGSDAANAHGGH